MMNDGWWLTFFVFKSLGNNIVSSLDIGVNIHIYFCAEQISCGFNIFDNLEIFMTIFKITLVE